MCVAVTEWQTDNPNPIYVKAGILVVRHGYRKCVFSLEVESVSEHPR